MYKHSGKVLVRDVEQPCPACLGLGYRGRTAVFEIMALDDQARALIAQNQMEALRTHLRKHKMLWLQEAGLFKAVEGATSIAEVTRVLAGKPA
jgi:type II secretory ATPase GspE/PulE/Tfp pilus assembly ATPase PilB-like protein